jgi:hypothetical protein
MEERELDAEVIGQFVLAFQSMEWALVEFFCDLVESTDVRVSLAIARETSFSRLATLTRAIAQLQWKQAEHLARLEAVLDKAEKLNSVRNSYVHSHYRLSLSEDGLEQVHRASLAVTGKRGFRVNVEEFSPLDFFESVNNATSIREELEGLHHSWAQSRGRSMQKIAIGPEND